MRFIKGFIIFVLVVIGMLQPATVNAKILVMTHCYNKPEFIVWQAQSFKKFLKDDYEFIVFNDTPNQQLCDRTENICKSLHVRTIRVPQSIHVGRGGPSVECGDTIQYMLNTVGFDYPGIVVLIDSDMFLIRDLHIEKFLNNNHLAALPQYREGRHGTVTYLLPNLMIFNMETLPDKHTLDFNLGIIDDVATDTAGFTFFYLMSHPQLKWLQTSINYVLDKENTSLSQKVIHTFKKSPKFWELLTIQKFDYEFYNDFAFLHFRAGSNWNKMESGKLAKKTQLLTEAMEELLK